MTLGSFWRHVVVYVMLLYLIGLLWIEGSLKTIASITLAVVLVLLLLYLICQPEVFKKNQDSVRYRMYQLVLGVIVFVYSVVSFSLSVNFSETSFPILLLLGLGGYDIWRAFFPPESRKKQTISASRKTHSPAHLPRRSLPSVTLQDLDCMDGFSFETWCARQMSAGGFKNVAVTSKSRDFGADVTAMGPDGTMWVIQCKRYSSNLGVRPVQEVVASKASYRAQRAAVITNSYFTRAARTLALQNRVVLIDRNILNGILKRQKGIRHEDMRI